MDPAAVAFGYDKATQLMEQQFGNVRQAVHPASLRVTDPEVVYLALTSYPPGILLISRRLPNFAAQ